MAGYPAAARAAADVQLRADRRREDGFVHDDGASFAVDPEDGSPEAQERARRAERALREVYEANALDQLDFDNEIDCSVLGERRSR